MDPITLPIAAWIGKVGTPAVAAALQTPLAGGTANATAKLSPTLAKALAEAGAVIVPPEVRAIQTQVIQLKLNPVPRTPSPTCTITHYIAERNIR